MQPSSIGYSLEEFSLAFQHRNGNSTASLAGELFDLHSDDHCFGLAQQPQNDNRFEDRCESVIQNLYSKIAPTLCKHPCYLHWKNWVELAQSENDHDALEEAWKQGYEQGLAAATSLESMYLSEKEWTFETAVADRLLEEGTQLYLESLEELKERPGSESLAWLEEAMFYLVAVEEWRAACV